MGDIMKQYTHSYTYMVSTKCLGLINFASWVILQKFVLSGFKKTTKTFNTIWVSNSLKPDQAWHLSGLIWVQAACKIYQVAKVAKTVGLDLGSNCLHNLLEDDKRAH